MKVIIIIVGFCCVALLPLNINGDDADKKAFKEFSAELNRIAKMGKNGALINGIFRLSKNGFLGSGHYSLTHKGTFEGTMDHNGKQVAMKFTPFKYADKAAREYRIYTYLYAIDNPLIESFGVPVVYYYHKYGDYMLMAMTLMDTTFNEKLKGSQANVVDMTITFRDLMKITKYIHSCGVRHDDIKCDNIMYRNHQVFLIDFNVAQKTSKKSKSGTPFYLPRSVHSEQMRLPKDDWESFLYSMCYATGIKLDWFHIKDRTAFGPIKQNTTNTLEKIGRIGNALVRNIFLKFAQYVLDDNNNIPTGFPNYDFFYQYFHNQTKKYNVPIPALLTWLTPEERAKALKQLEDPGIDISDMYQPALIPDTAYPEELISFFHEKYHSS